MRTACTALACAGLCTTGLPPVEMTPPGPQEVPTPTVELPRLPVFCVPSDC